VYIIPVNKSKLLTVARTYCANYNVGKCLGCMFSRETGVLSMKLDSRLVGKNCLVEDGCDYFDAVVIPGILDDRDKKTIYNNGEKK